MGLLVNGEWRTQWYDTASTGGRFVRQDSTFRDRIGADGFDPEPGRYHLYVSLACPWAHRTLIFRALKGLEPMIGVSVVEPLMLDDGWEFADGADTVNGTRFLRDVYRRARPDYTGRVTVPVLWDKRKRIIVSNESSEIIRMFNSAFDGVGARPGDYYPQALRGAIDAVNADVYEAVNNGVYKAGFATTQAAYDEAVKALFDTLDRLEERLGRQRYLVGNRLTEADWRLFTTLVRFDAVYHGHFKCNRCRLADYPDLWDYTRALFQMSGIAGTVNMNHIRRHYYGSHRTINPTGIVPIGPDLDFMAPHRRERFTELGADS